MGETAKVIILIGGILIITGLVMLVVPRLPFAGKLPGDILIKKEHFTFYPVRENRHAYGVICIVPQSVVQSHIYIWLVNEVL